MKNQKLFDVTLRDGLQSLPKNESSNYTLQKKKDLYSTIKNTYNPTYLEVGSLVSPKVLPIMENSLDLFKWSLKNKKTNNNFLLIPNSNKLTDEILQVCKNFSFITSTSQKFQEKNIIKSLQETKNDIFIMTNKISKSFLYRNDYFIKLYVSCINECPIEGKLNNDFIINELVWNYQHFSPDLLCISDTCGTLTLDDFKYIMNGVMFNGVPSKNISIHLHVNNENEKETINIIHDAFDRNIVNFDVSCFKSGGCSVTMNQKKMKNNLTYELYYKALGLYYRVT